MCILVDAETGRNTILYTSIIVFFNKNDSSLCCRGEHRLCSMSGSTICLVEVAALGVFFFFKCKVAALVVKPAGIIVLGV